MPTENRSSNTEMVSVPRELLGAIEKELRNGSYEHQELLGLLTQPAEQHQGEPVALPAAMHPHDFENLPEAHCNGWNACLDEIAKLGPLYPVPPDPGEVERCEARLHEVASLCATVEQERDALRTQLSERDALLRESYAELLAIKAEVGFRGATIALIGRIDAVLSASAEPSAPESCGACGGCTNGCRLDKDSPSAPVERDERAGFEAYALDKGWLSQHLKQRPDGNYEDWGVNPEWQAWKARAALERKPQVKS